MIALDNHLSGAFIDRDLSKMGTVGESCMVGLERTKADKLGVPFALGRANSQIFECQRAVFAFYGARIDEL